MKNPNQPIDSLGRFRGKKTRNSSSPAGALTLVEDLVVVLDRLYHHTFHQHFVFQSKTSRITDRKNPSMKNFQSSGRHIREILGSGKRTIFPGGDQLPGVVVVVVGGCWSYLKTPAEGLASILARLFFGVAARAEPPRLASPSLPSRCGRAPWDVWTAAIYRLCF